MIVSRITSKSQTTVPRAVRDALGLKPGDSLAYAIDEDGTVRIRSVREAAADPLDNPFAAFTEWADPLDDAYDNL